MPGTAKTRAAKKASLDVNRECKILGRMMTRYITDIEFKNSLR